MRKGHHVWDRVKAHTESGSDVQLFQTIVEITADRRILIENHRGVITYGKEKIIVNVKFGHICICGCGMEMVHMSKEQLVIFGRIQSVSLHRRDQM